MHIEKSVNLSIYDLNISVAREYPNKDKQYFSIQNNIKYFYIGIIYTYIFSNFNIYCVCTFSVSIYICTRIQASYESTSVNMIIRKIINLFNLNILTVIVKSIQEIEKSYTFTFYERKKKYSRNRRIYFLKMLCGYNENKTYICIYTFDHQHLQHMFLNIMFIYVRIYSIKQVNMQSCIITSARRHIRIKLFSIN